MAVGRYVIGDTATKKILSGPFKLDSADAAGWPVPNGAQVLTESAALAGGYTWSTVTPTTEETIRAKFVQALQVNAAFLAIASPTSAQLATQVTRLTRETNGLIRLLGQLLDDTSDT